MIGVSLRRFAGDRNAPQKHAWRAKIVLATAETFHFTPTSASWLNAVESFFANSPGAGCSEVSFAPSKTSRLLSPFRRQNQRRSKTVRLNRRSAPRCRLY
jgi:hypothetical protein